MKKEIDIVKVFIASPGNTKEERKIITEVVNDINKNQGNDSNFRIESVMWEEDSYSGIGSEAQDVINNQLYDYDIFLGLMNNYAGSPTKRARSGTEDEFDRAYEKYCEAPNKIRIMFYFRNSQMKLLDININQTIEVLRFKEKISDLGVLYDRYETTDEFRRKINNHLIKSVKEFIKNTGTDSESKLVPKKSLKKIIPINDWTGMPIISAPQWASYNEILLSQYNFLEYSIKGKFKSESEYFRFGFKLLTIEGKLYGDGNVQSNDNNLVIHIGKNTEDQNLFLTTYENGIRQKLNKNLFVYSNAKELELEIKVNANNELKFCIDGNLCFEYYINSAIKKRLLFLAWGDDHEYRVDFENISLELN